MSVIKVNKIENTNTTAGGVEVDSSGHVQVDGLQMPTVGPLSNRNIVINGAMNVAQRGTSQTSVSNGSNEGYQTLDRFGFKFGNNAGGVCTISQSTDVPSGEGFSNSYKVNVTTADTSLADSQMIYTHQGLEAQDVRNCGWNYTSTSSYITISFWVKSSKAGNYCITARALDVGHFYYNHTYTLAANTWTKVTHSIPGHASLVFNNDSGLGLDLRWQLAMAANRNDATTDTWQSGTENTSTDIVNFFDSTNNEFYLTGVQLEVGEKATPFEHRSYGDELARCQRYYWRGNLGAGPIYLGNGANIPVGNGFLLPVTMRATPAGTSISNVTAQNSNSYSDPVRNESPDGGYFYANMSVTAGTVERTDLCQCDAEL